jgi:hypothetical protein
MVTEFELVAPSDVGARKPSTDFSVVGLAYIFVKEGTGWTERPSLSASIATGTSDEFGKAVAIDGDYAIVGLQIMSSWSKAGPMFSIAMGRTGHRRAYLRPVIP